MCINIFVFSVGFLIGFRLLTECSFNRIPVYEEFGNIPLYQRKTGDFCQREDKEIGSLKGKRKR
jgi:hypothetical protein